MDVLASHVLLPVVEASPPPRADDEGGVALGVDPVDALARRFEQQACPRFGLPQRGLGPPLGVDVGMHPDPLPDAAPLVEDGDGPDEHVPVLAVVSPEPVLDLMEQASGHGRPPASRGLRPVVGVDGVEPAPALELVERLAGELAPARLLGRELAGRRCVPDDRRGGLDQGPEPFLPLAQGLFGPLRLGDVAGDAERADDAALLVAARHPGRRDPGDSATRPRLLFLLADHGPLGPR